MLEYFGPNRVEGSDDTDPFSASLRAAGEAFAQTGPEIVIAACVTARDELVGLLTNASAARPVPVVRVPEDKCRWGSTCGPGSSNSSCTATTSSAAWPA